MRRFAFAIVLAASFLAVIPAAHSASAVLVVSTIGTPDDAAVELVKATAERRLKNAGWSIAQLADHKAIRTSAQNIAQCALAAPDPSKIECIPKALAPEPAITHVVVTTITARGAINGVNDYEIRVVIIRRDGVTTADSTRFCSACTAENLDRTSEEVMVDSLKSVAMAAGGAQITITIEPRDARITVNGERASADTAIGVAPGNITVTAEREGYQTATQVVAIAANEHKPVKIALVPTGGKIPDDRPKASRNIWPGASLIALGVVGLGVGTYLIVTDDRNPAAGDPEPKYLRREPGLIIGGAGLVVGGVGAYLLWRELSKPDPREESAVHMTFGIAPGTAYVGAAGSF